MEKTVSSLACSIVGIRSGTITAGVVDTVKISCYGQSMPLKHLATTGKSGNVINIEPFDLFLVNAISKALVEAGFNAYVYSKTCIRVNCPPPSGDEKKRIFTHLDKLAEDARISVRNIRKKYRQSLAKEDLKDQESEIQKITDFYISDIDQLILNKKDKI